MEYFYTTYKKDIQGTEFFFVKRFLRFPEIQDAADLLVGYGMHTDFYKACAIAEIHDQRIQQAMLYEIEPTHMPAKIISMPTRREAKVSWLHKYKYAAGFALGKLRLRF